MQVTRRFTKKGFYFLSELGAREGKKSDLETEKFGRGVLPN